MDQFSEVDHPLLENPEDASFLLADLFCFDVPIATPRVLNEFLGCKNSKLGRQVMSRNRFRWLCGGKYFKENMISFEPGILLKKDCYLDGHWQNEKYFTAVEKSLETGVDSTYLYRKRIGKFAI